MDVVLLSASASLTARLSRQVGHELSSRQRYSVNVALGLSLGLFSLSILEATPPSWLVLLGHDTTERILNQSGYLSITALYRFLLWILCLWIVLVLPAIAGGQLLGHLASSRQSPHRDEEEKYSGWVYPWRKYRWIRATMTVLMVIPVLFFRIASAILRRLRRKYFRRSASEPVLIMTSSSETSPRGTSSPKSRSRLIPTNWMKRPQRLQGLLLGGLLGVLCSVAILRGMGKLVMQSTSQETHLLPTMVSWLCAVGLLLSSTLNGFGSVSLPHSCLAGFYLKPVRPETIAMAQVELEKTRSAWDAARSELSTLNSGTSSSREGSTRRRSSANSNVSRKSFVDYGDEVTHRKQVLQRDVEFLDTLVGELEEDVVEMKYAQATAASARTPMGKILSWLGVVFSIVLLVRLYTSMVGIWQGLSTEWSASPSRNSRSDPITTVLLWLTGHHFVSEQDYNALSQCISLLLTAFLSVSQVRVFLRTVSAIHRRLLRAYRSCFCTKNAPLSSLVGQGIDNYTHLLSAILGCYCLSCVVLTKMNLPLAYRSGFSAAMGGTTFVIQSSVANAVYAGSAVTSAITLGLLFGIQRQNTIRHAAAVDLPASMGNFDAC